MLIKKYEITEEQKEEITVARQKNKDKRVEAKLKVLALRAEGLKSKAISEGTGFHPAYISTLVSKYVNGGIEAITGNHYVGNRRNMSYEEEEAFLESFAKQA